jgi:carbamoyl-phosphate synthase large subunit
MDCFRDAAGKLGLRLRVLAADLEPDLSPACGRADAAFQVPRCTADEYLGSLLDICRREGVDLIVPTIDPELPVLSRSRELFTGAGVDVLISSPEVTRLSQDKYATAQRFAEAGVPAPLTVWLSDYLADPSLVPGPVIAKPNAGSASVGIVRPRSLSDLAGLDGEAYIVQECVAGIEYTVNLFFDRAGALRCAVPHRRLEVRAGEVSKGRTERHEGIIAAAQRLGASLPGATGPLCFQAIVRNDGSFAVFEINARFGGGYPLAHEAGATFSQWVLEELTGMPSSASDRWQEGVLMLRYDTAIFHRSPLS